ncbi:hypothetical protein [Amycolatopsis sp. NPDC052450]|uniref:hypothetical protein n=1 Tax=Amycolatopsis sp. NPDC052450 TaxID=3363937 RepID=UPI0037CC25DB
MRFDRALDEETLTELGKALRFFYRDVALHSDGDSFSVTTANGLPDDDIRRVVTHFLRGHRPVPSKVVAENTTSGDRAGELSDDDRVKVADGVYLQGPEWGRITRETEDLVVSFFAEEYGAPHLAVPALIPRDVLLTAGYYQKFPNLVNAVSRIRGNYWDSVTVAGLDGTQTSALATFYEPSDVVLNPVTCYHVYSRAQELLARYDTGLFTVLGPVFRHESHNHGPTRLAEFSMFELVTMGAAEQTTAYRDRFLASFERLFGEIGLPYRIVTAADAFYGDEPMFKRDAQVRGAGKYEVRIPLPEGELSVGSINLHGSVFTTAFGLDEAGSGIESTCCAGIGIDRLVHAMRLHGVLRTGGRS